MPSETLLSENIRTRGKPIARLLVYTFSMLVVGGCSTMILNANFEDSKYVTGGGVSGTIPGSPNGDRMNTTGETIAVWSTNPSQPIPSAITGQKSVALIHAEGLGQELENGTIYFNSALIDDINSRFTIYWTGKKTTNESTVTCNVGGTGTGADGTAAFRVSANAAGKWTVVDNAGSHILGDVIPRPTGQDAPQHIVDINYYPGSGNFDVEIRQSELPHLSFSGQVFANTLAQIQNTSRIGMWCLRPSGQAGFLPAYIMDGVVMREKDA